MARKLCFYAHHQDNALCIYPHQYGTTEMCQAPMPQIGQTLLHCFLWFEINLHSHKSDPPNPLHHILKTSTFCNIKSTRASTIIHNIEQPMQKQFHDLHNSSPTTNF